MFKEKLKDVNIVILILLIISSSLCIQKDVLYTNIHICINILMLIYCLICLYKKEKIKIIQSKLDFFMVLLVFSTIIPLVFNSFVSLVPTCETILNYLTLLWVYIFTRDMCKKNKNTVKYIKNVSLVFTIILIFLGIGNLCNDEIFKFMKIGTISNGEGRLISLITNPNSFAALIMFNYFISINEMLINIDTKKSILYGICNSIFILGILLTYSKFTFIVFPCLLFIYFILLKDRKKSIYMLHNLIQSLVMSAIYIFIFQKFLVRQYYLSIVVFSLFWLELVFIWNKKMLKVNIHYTHFIIGIVIVLLVGVIWVGFELHNKDEFVVFIENTQSDYNSKIIRNIKPNTKYILSLNIEAKVWGNEEKNEDDFFKIRIIERDSRSLEGIRQKEIEFGNFSGKKEIELVTNENTSEIKLEFTTKSDIITRTLVLKEFLINNEEIILEYKHLPTKFVEKIKDINLQNRTAQERIHFLRDGLKLISNNFLTGIGGDCWSLKYKDVQQYGYTSNDAHCYLIQIWLEFGILGLISIFGIIILVINSRKIDKEVIEKYRGIQFALIALFIHSLLDIDMSLWYIQVIFFINLGMYSTILKVRDRESKAYISNIVIIVVACITGILLKNPCIYNGEIMISKLQKANLQLDENSEQYKNNNYKIYEILEKMIKYEKYNLAKVDIATESINAYALSGKDNIETEAEKYYKRVILEENKWKYDSKETAKKYNDISVALNILEGKKDPHTFKWIVKLAKMNIEKFEEAKQELINIYDMEHKKPIDQVEYNLLMQNYDYANNMYKKYCLGINAINTTQVNLEELVQDNQFNIDNKQDIIIYHTHTTEAYDSVDYEEVDYKKTLNEEYNMVSVGEEFSNDLKQKGFKVTHLKTYNDIDTTNNAYYNSYDLVKGYLQEQGNNIDIIFDIHRDSYAGNENDENYIEIDSNKVAKLRFIIAVGHVNWKNNLKWAVSVQKKADEMYPGLFKAMYIYTGDYNQDLSQCATLIEVGHDENTVEEAKNSMKYLAEVIKETINNN